MARSHVSDGSTTHWMLFSFAQPVNADVRFSREEATSVLAVLAAERADAGTLRTREPLGLCMVNAAPWEALATTHGTNNTQVRLRVLLTPVNEDWPGAGMAMVMVSKWSLPFVFG